jgi:predicted metalloendopeptidase
MNVMQEGNRERLRAILEAAALAKAAAGSNEQKIGDFYSTCMDTARIETADAKPIEGQLSKIASVTSLKELGAVLNESQRHFPLGPFNAVALQDKKNTDQVVLYVTAGGLSLPERDYYFREDEKSKKIRDEFVAHVAKMHALHGEDPAKAEAAAKTVMEFETALAKATMTNIQRRDPYATYHPVGLEGISKLVPAFDWRALLAALSVDPSTQIIAMEPEFLKEVQRQFTETPLEAWKTWLRWRVLNGAASELAKKFEDQDFHFKQTVLRGVKEPLPRWQTCANMVDDMMGEALGQVYVQKHFPPAAKKRMLELVENLRTTLREVLSSADWLADETKKNAIAKLDAFAAKIGYPDKWKDYSSLTVGRDSFFTNVRRGISFERARNLGKIGKPVDRTEWGMTPPTVNAYYHPLKNEIAFPAGILQPPMFDMEADDAVNYGAIGAVIGHEMGHGFDDSGSQYAADGNLKNWWTPEDRKKFDARTACVVEQFDTLDVGDGLRHKGKLVVGEALGDLGGVMLSYKAYRRSLQGKEAPVLDGFTGDQRFFLAYARVWGTHYRAEAMRLRLNTDPHPLSKFRAVGTLQNVPEFHKAFQCKLGDAMVRPPDRQCKLW